MQTAPVALRNYVDATSGASWGSLLAMSIVTLIPVFLVFLVGRRHLVRGIATTGPKQGGPVRAARGRRGRRLAPTYAASDREMPRAAAWTSGASAVGSTCPARTTSDTAATTVSSAPRIGAATDSASRVT